MNKIHARGRACTARSWLLYLGTAALLAAAASLPSTAHAAELQIAPIPDMYLGNWGHHGASITITTFQGAPEGGSALVQWRTYTWCQDPTTKQSNPPPCDLSLGNFIEAGGIASIALFHTQGQDDRTLNGVIVATSDSPEGFWKWAGNIQFTMLPGNMLQVASDGNSTMFCGSTTDLSLYPPNPCGA
jgi:hypothetical protein